MRYFVRGLQIAIVESPLTAQATQRYATWHEVDRAWLRLIWMYRDQATLQAMRAEAEPRPVEVVEAQAERSVGSFQ